MINPKVTALLLVVALLSCQRESGGSADAGPPLATVTASRTDLLFRYRTAEGMATATRIDEIPPAARGQVQVIDLALTPEARASDQYVQLFDLRQADPQGHFPGRLILRAEHERALAEAEQAARPKLAPVILYSTSWCGVCSKARAFLKEKGIPYTEKDIEKDPTAARELAEKAAKAGVDASGVPVFDIGGKLLPGFDPGALEGAVRGG